MERDCEAIIDTGRGKVGAFVKQHPLFHDTGKVQLQFDDQGRIASDQFALGALGPAQLQRALIDLQRLPIAVTVQPSVENAQRIIDRKITGL